MGMKRDLGEGHFWTKKHLLLRGIHRKSKGVRTERLELLFCRSKDEAPMEEGRT